MTILGRDPQGNNIEITQTHRTNSIYMIGANGMGKTTMIENMVVEDISLGVKDGTQKLGVAVLDPHGDLINNIIRRCPEERLDDIILFDPITLAEMGYYFGLNLFQCDNMDSPKAVEFAVEQVIGIFSKQFGMSVDTPRLNQYVRSIAYSFVGTGYTMVDIPPLLLEKSFRDTVLSHGNSYVPRLFWKSFNELRGNEQLERSESTLDRVDSLVSNQIIRNIVGQSKTSINFRSIMDTGKILLVSLDARYESLTSLLGSIIIGQLLNSALSRAGTQKRRQFNLYADEYQRFSTPDFSILLTEARKFGIATTIAHQVRAQLDEKNAATALQAGSLVCFKITSEDADELSKEFLLQPRQAERAKQIVPRDCLRYVARHKNPDVRAFYGDFIAKLERYGHMREEVEMREEQIEGFLDTHTIREKVALFADFGEGEIQYDPKYLTQIYEKIEDLFYYVMTTEGLDGVNKEAFYDKVIGVQTACAVILKFYVYNKYQSAMGPPSYVYNERLNKQTGKFEVVDVKWDKYNEFYNKMDEQEPRYKRFQTRLVNILLILNKDRIFEDPPDYKEYTSQQTFNDKAAELANQLNHLPIGHARVKLRTGEYELETIIPNPPQVKLGPRKEQIIQRTINQFCRSRKDVEEEMQKRHTSHTPSTTRRGLQE